jgi:hypothetical protein
MHKKLYHVTDSLASYSSILNNGLRSSSDGYIYLLTNLDVADYVAVNQLANYKQYGIVSINGKGIFADLEPDLVNEITAKYQVKVKQELIETRYLKGVGMYWVTKELINSFYQMIK